MLKRNSSLWYRFVAPRWEESWGLHQLHRGDFEVEIKWTYAAFIAKSGIKRIFICRKQSLNISQTRNLEFLWLLFNHLSRKQKGKGEFSMYCETKATTTTNDVRLQFKSVYCVKTIAEMGIMRWFLVTRHLKRKWATFSHVSILSLTRRRPKAFTRDVWV